MTNDLTLMASSLIEFTRDLISSIEIMSQHITFRDELYSKIVITKFIVVKFA